MGRRKIVIAPITSERNRSVTYVKRKAGLFKKAHELAVLTDASIAVIVFGHNGKLSEFCSGDIDRLLLRYTEYNGPVERKGPDSFGGEEEEDDDDDAEGGGGGASGPAAGGGGGAGNQSSTRGGPSNSNPRGNGGPPPAPYPGASGVAQAGNNYALKADQSQWEDIKPSTTTNLKGKKNSRNSSRTSKSPEKTSVASTIKGSRSSKRISGKKVSQIGTFDETSNASGSEFEDDDGGEDQSGKVKQEEEESSGPPPMYTGKQFTKYFQPRLEGEHREGRDALKAAISSRGTAKGAGATNIKSEPTSTTSSSNSNSQASRSNYPIPDPTSSQHHHQQQSHLRHASEGSNSHRLSVPDPSPSESNVGPHRQMQPSNSFSGPFGFTSSASPAPQFQGVSPDLHVAGLAPQMRPFTAHGTGIGMAATASNQYQHMMGGNHGGGALGNQNLQPNNNAPGYGYLQSGGYDALSGSAPSSTTRPITAHGTGQAVHYSSQSPFSSSPGVQHQSHPSNSHPYPQSTSYSDLSGPVAPPNPQFYQPQMNKGYGNPNLNYAVGGGQGNTSYYPQNPYAQARPVSQGGISQLPPLPPPSSSHQVGYPLTTMSHPQYQEQTRNLQAQQGLQSSQGRANQASIQQQQQQQQQSSRPSSRGGPLPSSDGSPSPFSHNSASMVAPQAQNLLSTTSSDTAQAQASSKTAGSSPSFENSSGTGNAAAQRQASSGNTLAGQKRKSFELDDITLGSLASSSDLSMSNFRYDLSSASGELGHVAKSARPSTSGGEMASRFSSRDHHSSSSMFESPDLVGGGSHSTNSSFTRPSTSSHASSSSSSIGSLSTMPGLSMSSSSNTSDAGGDGSSTSINQSKDGIGASSSSIRERDDSQNSTTAFNDLVGSFLNTGTPTASVVNQSPSKNTVSMSESPNFTLHSNPNGTTQITTNPNVNGSKLNHHLDLVNHQNGSQRLTFDESGLTSLGSR